MNAPVCPIKKLPCATPEAPHDQHQWLIRAYLCLSVLTTCCIALFDVQSLNYKTLAASGAYGWAFVYVLCSMAALGLVDVFINDLLPDRIHIWPLRAGRCHGYTAIGIALCCLAYLTASRYGATVLLIRLLLDSTVAMLLATSDLLARHPEIKRLFK